VARAPIAFKLRLEALAAPVMPMFAPDEPDPANAEGNGYANNYLLSVGHRRAVCGADAHACT
jgi:hypothetical protein